MELSNPAQIKNISQYLFNLVTVVQDFGVRDRSRLDLFGGLGCLVICFRSRVCSDSVDYQGNHHDLSMFQKT